MYIKIVSLPVGRVLRLTLSLPIISRYARFLSPPTGYGPRLRKNRLVKNRFIKNILQYIFTNTLYRWWRILQYIVLVVENIAIYCIGGGEYCNILYWWWRILHYIVLVVENIAIYCIGIIKNSNIYLQYIVLAHCPSRYYPPCSCEFIMCCNL